MSILEELQGVYADTAKQPFLVGAKGTLCFDDLAQAESIDLSAVKAGDVVALIGDFEPATIRTLLHLSDLHVVLVPLTVDTRSMHEYFFEAAEVSVVVEGQEVRRLRDQPSSHPLLVGLREINHGGLVLFSTGTTGDPKAILHDFDAFLVRYRTPRPVLCMMNFLMFDHIGGINTLLHTLYNKGVVVVPSGRDPHTVLDEIRRFGVQVLPTTPTFLRMALAGGALDRGAPESLRIVTYGTERMDPVTLTGLCERLPEVDIRQTYGMSELGILRVKSKARDSLFMKVDGEGVETKIVDGVLKIRAQNRMLGYLNYDSPFDEEGWYDTGDLVESEGEFVRVVGRTTEVINIGGIKVNPSQIEAQALEHPDLDDARAYGVENPITGQHIELQCEVRPGATLTAKEVRRFLKERLPREYVPHKVTFAAVAYNHRYKSR